MLVNENLMKPKKQKQKNEKERLHNNECREENIQRKIVIDQKEINI